MPNQPDHELPQCYRHYHHHFRFSSCYGQNSAEATSTEGGKNAAFAADGWRLDPEQ
jgi:hypothetical protein